MNRVINPIWSRGESQIEQAEALLEKAEKQGKQKIVERIKEIISELQKQIANESPLISEDLYNRVYADLDSADE